jgi:arylsulfatase A-like enzyme
MRADAQVGRIVAAVDARAAARPSERWTIVATTDHGHLPEGGHGGQTRDETAIFVIARGPDFAAGVTDAHYSLVDVTPTVLDLLGGSAAARPRRHPDARTPAAVRQVVATTELRPPEPLD